MWLACIARRSVFYTEMPYTLYGFGKRRIRHSH